MLAAEGQLARIAPGCQQDLFTLVGYPLLVLDNEVAGVKRDDFSTQVELGVQAFGL